MVDSVKNNVGANSMPTQIARREHSIEVNVEQHESRGQTQYPKEEIENVVQGLNEFLQAAPHTHLKFEFHDQLNEYYITIVDETTKEIVKEIPPKKMLDMFAAMTEYIGILIDRKI